jgi:hypothetical protein
MTRREEALAEAAAREQDASRAHLRALERVALAGEALVAAKRAEAVALAAHVEALAVHVRLAEEQAAESESLARHLVVAAARPDAKA